MTFAQLSRRDRDTLKAASTAPIQSSLIAIKELVVLIGLAIAVHALVLRFVFPGYYNPLWPHHHDFYIPVELAQSALGFVDYLRWPRPVGQIFFDAIGHLGIHGSILAVLGLIMLNCALTAALFRRVVGIEMGWRFLLAFVAYVFLVFAHPYSYVFSTWDAFSQLSYTLLVVAAWCFFRYNTAPRSALLMVSVALALLGFLAKETYGLSALLLAAAWFLVKRQDVALRAAIPTIAVGAALAIALLINSINGSLFTGGAEQANAPYRIVLTPLPLITEWSRYAVVGLNPSTVGLLLLVALAAFIFMRRVGHRCWLALLLPAAGALAWLPNSALPNHYFPGYSWNGAYLLFAPILLIVPLWQAGRVIPRLCSVVIIALALGSPVLSVHAYKNNAWTLEQENIQRNLLKALGGLSETLPTDGGAQKVLVSGIDFPFSPFDKGLSMRMFPHTRNVQFDVVAYRPRQQTDNTSGVRFVSPTEVDLSRYQRVWAFRSDGTLAKDVREPAHFATRPDAELGLSAADLLIFPRLLDVFGDPAVQYADRKQLDGHQYLVCGTVLLSYENLAGAERCLIQSSRLISENPYPYFYLGNLQEKQGMTELARASFERAMALDDPKSPNPWFRKALEHVNKPTSAPVK